MATIRLPPDFKELLKLFNSHGVEYLLVGGFSVGYYGYPRSTGDIDLWVGTSRRNAERIVAALSEFGFGATTLSVQQFREEDRIVRMGVPPLRVDILTGVSGLKFRKCYAARRNARIDGIQVNVISLEHLKENKRASGRHKDLDDLENLP